MPVSDIPFRTHILSELAGCAGNFGTVLPLLFAVSVASGMHLSLMLLSAGIWYIISGLYYRIPVPIEPLKAVGAIAIAEHITPQMIAASGILTGAICLVIGMCGFMNRIQKIIPGPVIRGVQLGLALILVKSAIPGFIIPDIPFAIVSGIIVVLFFLAARHYRTTDFSALIIITAGFVLAVFTTGFHGTPSFPVPELVIPEIHDFYTALIVLIPPQIPLTLTNAILATSLLITDLFKKDVNPDRLCKTVGIMSVSSSLFGGFPMCHGAGGLAAHYRFGARTGLSLVFGGLLLIVIAGICTFPDIVSALPKGMFGILLVVVAIELARHGLKTTDRIVSGIIAVLSIPFGLAIAFVAGFVFAWGLQYHKKGLKN
ncbi:putative sulfate/molybdate transporter [Methanospirillum stamsii]|uniref:Sulfate transporter n=1 Tax=Methanospirillum stamsii TaxID=1277351 RepID=A0A2V2NHQ8_9EURY|nr:putative sulfate/molybdate transporter [Methanospirillum stamsii]PWR74863.1 sulfate transporter [Methanospirillum stamsii]